MGAAGAEVVEDLRHRDVRGRFRRLLAHVLLCFGRQMVVVTMLYRSSGLFLCFFLSKCCNNNNNFCDLLPPL
ncbi:hypothetical protein GW17_00028755 [Ensete ventricosum]|nr:hypothetical protein GW17_00028755 [Ensete ventricosum]